MAPRALPPRDARGRFMKPRPAPLPAELVEGLGQDRRIIKLLADQPFVLKADRPIHSPVKEGVPWQRGHTKTSGNSGPE